MQAIAHYSSLLRSMSRRVQLRVRGRTQPVIQTAREGAGMRVQAGLWTDLDKPSGEGGEQLVVNSQVVEGNLGKEAAEGRMARANETHYHKKQPPGHVHGQ